MKYFLEAGFSKIDLTPPLERMAAYGIGYWYQRHVRFTGVRDPLFVRTLVMGVLDSRQVMVSVDSIFDSYGFVESATRRIADYFSIPAANILISCTHTHSSPLVGRNNTHEGAEYGEFVAQRIVQSALDAAGRAVDTFVTIADADVENVLYNRRPLLANGSIAELHRPVSGPNIVDAGPLNKRMTVVNFRDRAGHRIGGLCHFGIHGVAVQCSELVSSDCMGRAIQALEQEESSLVLLHLNGACGDIDPALMGDDHSLDVMTERLSSGLRSVLNAAELPLDRPWPGAASAGIFRAERRCTRTSAELEASLAVTAETQQAPSTPHHSGSGYERFLLAEEAAVAALPEKLEINYQLLRLGHLIFAGIGGEVFTRSGLELQASLRDFVVFPIGLAGGAAGYLPLKEMYLQGGYEVACAQWCPIACGEPEKLFAQIARDLHRIAGYQAA